MSRPPSRRTPPVVVLLVVAGTMLFAATASFVVGPALFPRQPGTFSVAQVALTTAAGMVGAFVGVGIGTRLARRKP